MLVIRLPNAEMAWIKELAVEADVTVSEWVRRALQEALWDAEGWERRRPRSGKGA